MYSLQVYWIGIFILPKKIIKNTEQKFNRFMWNRNIVGSAKAKIFWKDLCFPKKDGELGLKSLEVWNQTLILRHVWSLFARSGSIWVAKVKDNYLRMKSLWGVDIPQNYSWSWRKILKLRDKAKRFLRFEVGNREYIHLWLDSWHPFGVLLENYGYRVMYDAQSRVDAKLSYVIFNGEWYWGPTRSDDLVEIQSRLHEVRFGLHDKPLWTASRKRCLCQCRNLGIP